MATSLSKLTLRKDQLALLSSYYQQFAESLEALLLLNQHNGYKETAFQTSLLLQRLLKELEDQRVLRGAPKEIEAYAAVLLNAEFFLIERNSVPELRYNPFLRHWVEVVVRIQPLVLKVLNGEEIPGVANIPEWWAKAQAARLLLIKWAFGLTDGLKIQYSTPAFLIDSVADLLASPIDPTPFADLLVTQGIPVPTPPSPIHPDPDTLAALSTTHSRQQANIPESRKPPLQSASAASPGGGGHDAIPDEAVFYEWYHSAPGEALQWLIRLPPTLAALDFLTKILSAGDEAFKLYNVSAADVAREHLQHALRHVEELGGGVAGAGANASSEALEGGAAEQAQAVKVLVVYLRNLIGRGILPLDLVYLDVQEVCVRYIFLAEVREFRTWLQGAVDGGTGAIMSPGVPAGG